MVVVAMAIVAMVVITRRVVFLYEWCWRTNGGGDDGDTGTANNEGHEYWKHRRTDKSRGGVADQLMDC
jgi:hypothetical protein